MNPDVSIGPRLIAPPNPSYPERLLDLPVPPRGLWVDGRAPAFDDRLVAVVGSRAASRKGVARVFGLARDLADAGWNVISGGALGIDAAAHRGALDANGDTYAVLGCGIDVVYPDRHAGLFRQIAGRGGLLSEYGVGVPPRPGQFPARNRLVAALARAVIVAESRAGSGALITARQASALGRLVLAIPGSPGADRLLATGAAVAVETATDVIAVLSGKTSPRAAAPVAFDGILRVLVDGPADADVIARRLGLSLGDTLGALFEAELGGFIARIPGGRFEATRGY